MSVEPRLDAFDPGPDWTRVGEGVCGEPDTKPNLRVTLKDGTVHWYIRARQVGWLPTAPWTVLRARLGDHDEFYVRQPNGMWQRIGADPMAQTDEGMREQIAVHALGFEVVAEPRDVITKRVAKYTLDRVRQHVPDIDGTLARIGRDFGVDDV